MKGGAGAPGERMEGVPGPEWTCGWHSERLASFAAAYLQPPQLFFARRAEAEPVLQAILRATDGCPQCRRRSRGVEERRVGLASQPPADSPAEVIVRVSCAHHSDGHWACSYDADVKRKILLLGDAHAKKTELLHPAVFDPVDDGWRDSLGAKVMTRHETVSLPEQGIAFHVVFTVWDIAGHRFSNKEQLATYFRGARGVLAVCDLADEPTVPELDHWLIVAERLLGKIPVVILARGRTAPDPLPISEARLRGLAAKHPGVVVLVPPDDPHRLEHVFHGLGIDTIRDVFGTEWHPPMYV